MASPFNSVAEIRQFIRDLDSQNCPVAQRQRQVHEEERERERKEREARRQREEQQQASARNSETWNTWINERIRAYLLNTYNVAVGNSLGAIRAQMRKEFQAVIDTLRDELKAVTNKLHDEIDTRLARLPLEVKTWEPVSEALDQIRQQAHEQARSELQTAVATLRDEFNATTSKLRNEINTRLARLPLVKTWEDRVHYVGDVVVDGDGGGIFQAKCDTGRPVTSDDWVLLARAGCDGRDGDTPRLRGAFDAHEEYRRFDIAEFDGSSFIALDNDPGIPGDPSWQLLCSKGTRGPAGDAGPRGQSGELSA
jgi:hypothetical protein